MQEVLVGHLAFMWNMKFMTLHRPTTACCFYLSIHLFFFPKIYRLNQPQLQLLVQFFIVSVPSADWSKSIYTTRKRGRVIGWHRTFSMKLVPICSMVTVWQQHPTETAGHSETQIGCKLVTHGYRDRPPCWTEQQHWTRKSLLQLCS